MMWVGAPAYFAVVLVRTIWLGGVQDESGKVTVPPTPHTTIKIERSIKQCETDGNKWEKETIKTALKGKADVIEFNNGVWNCFIQATGGLST